MADVAVDARRHQRGGLFEGQELRFGFAPSDGFSLRRQRAHPENKREDANDEQEPGDKLVPDPGVKKPNVQVENQQSGDQLPSKETIEAV